MSVIGNVTLLTDDLLEVPKMIKRMTIFFTCYILAIVLNFFTAIKYPDVSITSINAYTSIAFLVIASYIGDYLIKNGKMKFLKIYLLAAIVSGILVYISSSYASFGFLDGIAIFLYIVFISPLFGLNAFLELSYGEFSLAIVAIYLFISFLIAYRRD